MLATLVIVLREVIEAGLIVGIVLAATKGVAGRSRWIAYGIVAGLAGACVVAGFAGQLAELFEGAGQELFNAAILLLAVGMLTWHNAWMASHGQALAQEVRRVGASVAAGDKPPLALAVVCFAAVLREGSGQVVSCEKHLECTVEELAGLLAREQFLQGVLWLDAIEPRIAVGVARQSRWIGEG